MAGTLGSIQSIILSPKCNWLICYGVVKETLEKEVKVSLSHNEGLLTIYQLKGGETWAW